MTLSEHVEKVRKDNKLTRVEMADAMGINVKTYASRVIGDGSDFTIGEIRALDSSIEDSAVNKIAMASLLKREHTSELKLSVRSIEDGILELRLL